MFVDASVEYTMFCLIFRIASFDLGHLRREVMLIKEG